MTPYLKKMVASSLLVVIIVVFSSTLPMKGHASDSELLIAYPLYQETYFGHSAIDIGILNPATGEILRLNVGLLVAPEFIQGSQNGHVFYYASEGTYVIKVDGSEHYLIPGADALDWSPDGEQLLVLKAASATETKLYIMDIEGKNRIEVAGKLKVNWATWSPDGQQIALDVDMGNQIPSELFIVNADGTNLRRITHNNIADGFPQWSPSGRYLSVSHDYGIEIFDFKNDARSRRIYGQLDGVVRWAYDDQVFRLEPTDGAGIYDLVLTNIWDYTSEILVTIPQRPVGLFPSPNGHQIVYSVPSDGNRSIGNICIFNLDTKTEKCFENVQAYCCGGAVWVSNPTN